MLSRSRIRNTWLVARRDYFDAIRTKTFWFGVLAGPIIMIILIAIAAYANTQTSLVKYAVYDNSNGLTVEIRNEILKLDLYNFLGELDRHVLTDELLVEVKEKLQSSNDYSKFIESVINAIGTLSSSSSSVDISLNLAQRFGLWWIKNSEVVISMVPSVSFTQYWEIQPKDPSEESLVRLLENDSIQAFFVVPSNFIHSDEGARYVSKSLTKFDLYNWYRNIATKVVRRHRLYEAQIEEAFVQWLNKPANFAKHTLTQGGSPRQIKNLDTIAQFIPGMYFYCLWFMVFMSAMSLMTNTIEEKSSKLIEVLLSSIRPVQLMDGKIFGVAFISLTMFGVWIFMGLAIVIVVPATVDFALSPELIKAVFNPFYLLNFVIFFVLAFLFYGSILCAIGSVCSNPREAGNLATPVNLFMMIPLVLAFPIVQDPSGAIAQVMSFVPLFTPFVMTQRAAAPPGLVSYTIILFLMVISVWGVRVLTQRIFAHGILMESKPTGIRQFVGLARYNVKQ